MADYSIFRVDEPIDREQEIVRIRELIIDAIPHLNRTTATSWATAFIDHNITLERRNAPETRNGKVVDVRPTGKMVGGKQLWMETE